MGTITLPEEITMTQLMTDTQETMRMLRDRLQKERPDRKTWPGALSGFTVDRKKIYFATSIKGPGRVPGKAGKAMRIQKQVIKALEACNARDPNRKGHNNSGKCGEIMTTNAWFKENGPNSSLVNQDNKLMVTVAGSGRAIPPCQDSHKDEIGTIFGCCEYLHELGFKPGQVHGWEDQTCPPPNSPTAPNKPETQPETSTPQKPETQPETSTPQKPETNPNPTPPKPETKPNPTPPKPETKPKTPAPPKQPKTPAPPKPETNPKTPPPQQPPVTRPKTPTTNPRTVKKPAVKKATKRAPVRRHARMFG
ncbi:hypothetical protein BDZ91DRAFT_709657 [Kalaharituber pfeilii]|nr:hypothetical protein BDZ91DRAFT_709657 [Kalaharituber pfeilii]